MKKLIVRFSQEQTSIPLQVGKMTLDFLRANIADIQQKTYQNDEDLLAFVQQEQITVVVSDASLSRATAQALQSQGIVIITICKAEQAYDLVDICIDPLSSTREMGLTGPAYLLPEIVDTLGGETLAKEMGISEKELLNAIEISTAQQRIPHILSLFRKLAWDSDFFGFNVASIACLRLTENIQKQVASFIEKEKIELLEYQCDCHDRTSILVAEKAGYSFVDIRLTFSQKLLWDYSVEQKPGVEVRKATEEDIPALRSIAHDAYQDSRYYFDGHFDREKLIQFYELWAEKAVRGQLEDFAYVVTQEGKVAGFVSIKMEGKHRARIGLVGVDSSSRGAGLGMHMFMCVLKELQDQGIEYVHVTTQGRNYAAQRLYQKCGFLTEKTELWYHKWNR